MIKRVNSFLWRIFSRYLLPYFYLLYGNKLCLGEGTIIYGFPILEFSPKSTISVGKKVVLCSKSENTALGLSKPVILRTLSEGALIKIGANSGLSGTTICAMQEVTIGKDCLVGADVTIFDNDFHPIKAEGRRNSKVGISASPVRIQDNVFIGTKSVIMKGVTIGENSVIGAGSVVSSNIAANVIAAGNPCKVLKRLED